MTWIVGIDEAGRGPLAGPVAVGLVRVPAELELLTLFPGLNDSKKLSEKKREEFFSEAQAHIRAGSFSAKVVLSSNEKIDTLGISRVIRSAIAQGLESLAPETDEHRVFLDGALRAPEPYAQETVIGGDGSIPAIMLASVLAKVTRDRYMKKIAAEYPEYGFDQHKGYGTKAHLEAIKKYGMCTIHRSSFIHLDHSAA